MKLLFNDKDFKWREDRHDTLVAYRFGGRQVLTLTGSAKKRFLQLIDNGEFSNNSDIDSLAKKLLEIGLFILKK